MFIPKMARHWLCNPWPFQGAPSNRKIERAAAGLSSSNRAADLQNHCLAPEVVRRALEPSQGVLHQDRQKRVALGEMKTKRNEKAKGLINKGIAFLHIL